MIENIKDEINGKTVIIIDGIIQYGKKKISIKDIVNYNYSHSYYNGVGGLSFELFTLKESISFYAESSPIKRIFKADSTQNNFLKLESLMNKILPIVTRNFLERNIAYILSGRQLQIWQLIFHKDKIEFQTRFWKKNIFLNYHETNVYYRQHKLGLVGGKGTANYLYIKDEKNGVEYRYSRNPESQANPSDFNKIQMLISSMRSILPYPNLENAHNDFKPLI